MRLVWRIDVRRTRERTEEELLCLGSLAPASVEDGKVRRGISQLFVRPLSPAPLSGR